MSSSLQQEKARPKTKTRIARFFAPPDLKDSPHLPGDRWLVSNAFDIFRSDKEMKKGFARLCIFAAMTLLAAGAGVAGVIGAAAVPALSIGIGAAALAGAAILAVKTRDSWNVFRKESLRKLRAEIAVRYINLKGSELREKWKRFFSRKITTPAQKPANAAAEKNNIRKEPDPRLKALFDLKAIREVAQKRQASKPVPPANGSNQPPAPK